MWQNGNVTFESGHREAGKAKRRRKWADCVTHVSYDEPNASQSNVGHSIVALFFVGTETGNDQDGRSYGPIDKNHIMELFGTAHSAVGGMTGRSDESV